MWKSVSKKVILGAALGLVALSCLIPAQRAEASSAGTAAAIFSGVAGAMVGAGLQRAADRHHQRHVCYHYPSGEHPATMNQKYIMKSVLANYNPAFHNMWVEYVMIDLMDQLTPQQQKQLIGLMEQRRANSCYPAVPYAA